MGPGQIPIIEPKNFFVRRVGIVTAMRMEARCITRGRLPFNQKISLGQSGSIWLCGMGEEAARQAAKGLKKGGATALMSFGFAGALDSSLRPGDLVLPETVHAGYSMPVDLGWRSRLRQMLPASLSVSGGTLVASKQVLSSASAKLQLARVTGARAVDMESGAVAETAVDAGLPFLAVRVISDAVEFSPPPALLAAIRPDGSADLVRLLPLLVRGSVTLPTLLRLAVESRAACSTLSAVARYANAELGIAQ
jgi:adenosylhomocysteine nucleosidase